MRPISKLSFAVPTHAAVALCVLSAILVTTTASAQTAGRYVADANGYTITVQVAPGRLTVTEPNKTSEYRQTQPNVYEFTNPTNGIHYALRVVDANTLEAFKPGSGAPGTILRRQGASAAAIDAAPSPPSAYEGLTAIAAQYQDRASRDPANAQVWSMCAAAGRARADRSDAQADAYAREVVRRLKPLMVDPLQTPCANVISQSLWSSELANLTREETVSVEMETVARAKRRTDDMRDAIRAKARLEGSELGARRAQFRAEVQKRRASCAAGSCPARATPQ
jgi:hypothetical protein